MLGYTNGSPNARFKGRPDQFYWVGPPVWPACGYDQTKAEVDNVEKKRQDGKTAKRGVLVPNPRPGFRRVAGDYVLALVAVDEEAQCGVYARTDQWDVPEDFEAVLMPVRPGAPEVDEKEVW